MGQTSQPLLEVRDLKKYFPLTGGVLNRTVGHVRAVDGVSFVIRAGECFALVGESGSGKTTVGRTILRAMSPTAGQVLFRVDGQDVDLASAPAKTVRSLRRHMQMVFQDPYSSLNPRMTVLDIIGEPLLVNGMRSRTAREERVSTLLRQVGLPEHILHRYPHAFSGGQRQRIGIARALALQPKLVVADEPVSALDVSVQAQVLNLLQELQASFGLTYLFIAHDLGVVRHVADRVGVMYAGRLMETAGVEELFATPKHPYTAALLAAMPVPDPSMTRKRVPLIGEVADPGNLPAGCVFHPRCVYTDARCREVVPDLRELTPDRSVRCHRADELRLPGM